jgi:hypothetical protein
MYTHTYLHTRRLDDYKNSGFDREHLVAGADVKSQLQPPKTFDIHNTYSIYVYTYIHTYLHTYTHTYTHTYIGLMTTKIPVSIVGIL